MSDQLLDVVGIGNAIMDIISHAEDADLVRLGLERGAMSLIGSDRAKFLFEEMGARVQLSGGSAGNTVAGLASLGAKTGYIGKVARDSFGDAFRHDITSLGVRFTTMASSEGPPTAQSLIFVTPDGQRTMNTFLGACVNLAPEDLDIDLIRSAKVLYLEGYLFDPPQAKEAFYVAARAAQNAGRKVALTLSDPFCVDRHREAFQHLIENHVDILFANEVELLSLCETYDWNQAIESISSRVEFAALTRGPKGSLIVTSDQAIVLPAAEPTAIVDTTGAGDLYAAGVLFGIVSEYSPRDSGWLGSLAAAEVISHFGGRPETDLVDYVNSHWRQWDAADDKLEFALKSQPQQ